MAFAHISLFCTNTYTYESVYFFLYMYFTDRLRGSQIFKINLAFDFFPLTFWCRCCFLSQPLLVFGLLIIRAFLLLLLVAFDVAALNFTHTCALTHSLTHTHTLTRFQLCTRIRMRARTVSSRRRRRRR